MIGFKTNVSSVVLAGCALFALLAGKPLSNVAQQTITSSSTKVVVVVIPGFPFTSIALGLLVGITAIVIRRRQSYSV